MKATIEDLQDSFKISFEAAETSRAKARETWALFHNQCYTADQLNILRERGQPAETFNVIKMMSRMLLGYYSNIVNTVRVVPIQPRYQVNATVLNDVIASVFEQNRFDTVGNRIKLEGLITGLMVSEINVVPTGERDQFNRVLYEIKLSAVPESEVLLDPLSREDDYSDARWLHRFRWMPEESVIAKFGRKVLAKLKEYENATDATDADFEQMHGEEFTGKYRVFNNYLIVHSVLTDDKGERWSCFWSGDELIKKEKITFKTARWPYRVEKIQEHQTAEYYGVFNEITESQHAINQAVLRVQQLINTQKAFVENGSVRDINQFTRQYNRVTGVIEVLKLGGIKLENSTAQVQEQYAIIDNALNRIQRVLGINDSFLGMAFASDSGRKVKLQQNATIMSLAYITQRIESFYSLLGSDIALLAQQYFKANQVLPLTDVQNQQRWIELNKPMSEFTGQYDMQGQPIMEPILLPVVSPETGEYEEDDDGNIVIAPVDSFESSLEDFKFYTKLESAPYNDEDERTQLMLETFMSGQIGQMLTQVNPAGFFEIAALTMKSMRTRHSPAIVSVLEQTAQMITGQPTPMTPGSTAQQPKSRSLKLPTNTNEEV